jgi:hypothetical protein
MAVEKALAAEAGAGFRVCHMLKLAPSDLQRDTDGV